MCEAYQKTENVSMTTGHDTPEGNEIHQYLSEELDF